MKEEWGSLKSGDWEEMWVPEEVGASEWRPVRSEDSKEEWGLCRGVKGSAAMSAGAVDSDLRVSEKMRDLSEEGQGL